MADSFVLFMFMAYFTIIGYCVEDKGPVPFSLLDIQHRILTTADGRIINFKCTSTVPTMMCAVEFLLNGVTVNNLRSTNKICYQMTGVCDPSICICSEDCRTFQLNYTDKMNMKNFYFGCSARFEDDMKNTHQLEIIKYFNGTVSFVYEKENTNDNKQSSPDENGFIKDETSSSDNTKEVKKTAVNDTSAKTSSWMWFALLELLLLLVILFGAIINYIRNRDKGHPATEEESLGLLESNAKKKEGNNIQLQEDPEEKSEGKTNAGEEDEKKVNGQDTCKGSHHCNNCDIPATCAICIDCERRYCEICIKAHSKYYRTHSICQIQHVFSRGSPIVCKVCLEKRATKVCSECNKIICANCAINHLHDTKMMLPLNPEWKRMLTVSTSRDGHELNFENELTVHNDTNDPLTRISGLAILPNELVIVADMNNNKLQVYKNYKFLRSFIVVGEPRGIASMSENKLAVTYGHSHQIVIYKFSVDGMELNTCHSIDIGKNKPFAISHNEGHLAVEANEGEDGLILITDQHNVLHRIKNTNCAYFTGNTIRLALDIGEGKVFVAAMSKKAISCLNFSGEILWNISLPSPRSMALISGSSFHSLIVASRRCSAIYRLSTKNGKDEILMAKGAINSPRYIAVDEENKTLCIEVGVEPDELKIIFYKLHADNFVDIAENDTDRKSEENT